MALARSLVCAAIALVLCGPIAMASDWPQLQRDPAHTGYSPDPLPDPPYRLKWSRNLGAAIAPANQPIIAGQRVFIGTAAGDLHALDRDSGQTLWQYATGAPILGAAAHHEGIVFVNSMDHACHALAAEDGKRLWRFETQEGIWAAPVIADGLLFVAGRDGFVYALEPKSGQERWRSEISAMVQCTPAYADGRLYVAGRDMRIRALDGATGKELWQSAPLPGGACREYWLVASHGRVIVTTQYVGTVERAYSAVTASVLRPFVEKHKNDPVLVEDEAFAMLRSYFEQNPATRTVFALDAANGKEKFIPPVIGVHGGSCNTNPPMVTPDGWAYTVYANIRASASGNAFLGRFRLSDGHMESCFPDFYAGPGKWEGWPGHLPKTPRGGGPRQWGTPMSDFSGGFCVTDQAWVLSGAGDQVLITHAVKEMLNSYNRKTGADRYLVPEPVMRRLPVGVVGGQMHSTASPMAISGNQVFWNSQFSMLYCFEPGRDNN